LERSRALRSDDTEVNSVDPTEARNINMKVGIHVRPRASELVRMLTGKGPEPGEQAAGIASASQIPRVVSPHDTCVEQGCQWLHYVCTEEALSEIVAAWHGLAPEVREEITELVRTSRV
jgi:Mg2+ and Co2+ transporter CorA